MLPILLCLLSLVGQEAVLHAVVALLVVIVIVLCLAVFHLKRIVDGTLFALPYYPPPSHNCAVALIISAIFSSPCQSLRSITFSGRSGLFLPRSRLDEIGGWVHDTKTFGSRHPSFAGSDIANLCARFGKSVPG
jgi:hypothetical protein